LVFFALGLAIVLQTRRSSRLDLARSLRWLALFGFAHGFHEWGDLFIPIQSEHFSPPIVQLLYIIQLVLLAGSFAFLFEFGVTLLKPLGRARWLHGFAAGIMLIWIFVIFFVLLPFSSSADEWRRTSDALARYFIGFPGGILAAYGLRQQTLKRIAPLNVPVIVSTLRVVDISLFMYSVLAGLIPPPISFFPGNVFNVATFEAFLGVPPLIFRSLIGLILTVTIIRALEIFDVETERRIEVLEQQQIISAERERLARELHDGAIQKVYTAGLLVESATRLAQADSEIASRLENAERVLNDSIADLRRNLSELHSSAPPDSESLNQSLNRLAANPHYNSLVDITLHLGLREDKTLSPLRKDHLVSIVIESLANIMRHAQAKKVNIQADDLGERLRISIKDDGIGYDPNSKVGYGVRNMRDRARLLNGELNIAGTKGKGTVVSLEIPWMDN
jgi:signal transduction histidine kinase